MKISGVETTGVQEGDWHNDMAETVKGEMCLDLCQNLFLSHSIIQKFVQI